MWCQLRHRDCSVTSSLSSNWVPTIDDSLTVSVQRETYAYFHEEAECKVSAPRRYICRPLTYHMMQAWFVIWSRSIVMSFSNKPNVPGSGSRRKPKLKQHLITALRQQDQHHLESPQRDATVVKGCLRRVTVSAACLRPCFCAPHIYLIQFAYIVKGQYWSLSPVVNSQVVSSNQMKDDTVFYSLAKTLAKTKLNLKLFKPDFQSAIKKKPTFFLCSFPNL